MPLMGCGTHIAKVKNAVLSESSKGTPQVILSFQNQAGEHIDAYLYLSDKALERTEKALRACGWVGDDISELMRDGVDLKEVEIVVEDEEYDGKVRTKVKWINPIRKEMDADKAKAIALALRKKFKGPADDDGVPF